MTLKTICYVCCDRDRHTPMIWRCGGAGGGIPKKYWVKWLVLGSFPMIYAGLCVWHLVEAERILVVYSNKYYLMNLNDQL